MGSAPTILNAPTVYAQTRTAKQSAAVREPLPTECDRAKIRGGVTMVEKVVRTETIAAKGWDGDDIVDIVDDLSLKFKPDEKVVVIPEAEYDRLRGVEAAMSDLIAEWKRLFPNTGV